MENELVNSLVEQYKLPYDEHQMILEELKKRLFANKKQEQNPSAMFVIGQPGCGKTTFIQRANLSNYIVINSDEYRRFNRYSDEILSKYPTYYTKCTNYDAHLWGDELFEYAINNGFSVLREKAPVDLSLLEVIKKIHPSCNIVINLVATGNLSSLLATRERYETEIIQGKNGRLSNIDSHNRCYNVLPDFISKCLELGVEVNYIIPRENDFTAVSIKNNEKNKLEEIRKQSNKQASMNYKAKINAIKELMQKRGAPQEQFDELDKIQKIYLELNARKNTEENKEER